ncbi:unnamed protein product, partial [Porites evermanni]
MVFTTRCVCTKHSTWSHGNVSPDVLRVADPEELRFCEVDSSKNKGRKTKICLACCGRLATKMKCMRLEERLYFCNCHSGRIATNLQPSNGYALKKSSGVGHPSPSIPGSTVPVQQPTPVSVPGSTDPVQQPTPVSVPGSTASLQQPTPV